MAVVKTGYFNINELEGWDILLRVYWQDDYNASTGEHTVSITSVQGRHNTGSGSWSIRIVGSARCGSTYIDLWDYPWYITLPSSTTQWATGSQSKALSYTTTANSMTFSYDIAAKWSGGQSYGYSSSVTLDLTHTHSYTSKVTSPTCTAQGYTTYTCGCGHSYKGNYTSALGHSYTYAVTTSPTVSSTGTLKGTCSRCSATTTATLPKLNTTDYTYKVITAATCTATGIGRYTWNTTTYGTFYFNVTIAALGHIWDDGVVTTKPTHFDTGTMTYTCTRSCGTTKSDLIARLIPTVYMGDGENWNGYRIYIGDGENWNEHVLYIGDGENWHEYC